MSSIWVYLSASPLLWLTLTVLAYVIAVEIFERLGRTPDKAGIALVLHERGPALRLPAAGLEVEEYLERGCDVCGRTRHIEMDGAVLGQAMALAAQFLEFLGSQRVAQQFIGIPRRIETGADMGLQHQRMRVVFLQ